MVGGFPGVLTPVPHQDLSAVHERVRASVGSLALPRAHTYEFPAVVRVSGWS